MSWLNRSNVSSKPVNWKINLAAIWASQFLSLAAFSFCLPFLPLYLRESKIVAADQAGHWSGVLLSVSSISMMVFAPIWGSLGDRYGRKMMLVRANLAGGFVLYLTGIVDNIEAMVVLRVLHGAFTGTVPAAQTLVATHTPDRNQGFAIGLVMAAVNAGTMAGNYFGGICAKHYGPVFSFKLGGGLLMLSTVLVMVAVRETFTRPEKLPAPSRSARLRRRRESINSFKAGFPIMATIGFIAFIATYDNPYLALYVDHLFRDSQIAAGTVMGDAELTREVYGITGMVSVIASATATAGSIIAGVIMDRKIPAWVWAAVPVICAFGAYWISRDPTLAGLTYGRALFYFFISGLASVLVVILGRMTPSSKRGAAMGWSVTARCFGWIFAPLLGAYLSERYGWSNAYLILTFLCLPLVGLFIYLNRRYEQAFHSDEEDPPSIGSVGKSHVSAPGGQGRVG